jgi:chromate transporter
MVHIAGSEKKSLPDFSGMQIVGTVQDAACGDNPGLAAAARVWSRIGWLGFGGPAGQIALMHRELVERRRWISEPRFLHALNYCMLLPGPEAQQLAVYIGWLMHRTRGGIVAGVLFVLPGAIVLGLLSFLYVRFGQLPFVSAVFFGLKAAVLAIVVEAVLRIGKRALKTRFLVALAALAFIAIFALKMPFPWIVLAAAAAGLLASRIAPAWLPAPKADNAASDEHYLVDRMLARGEAAHTTPSFLRAALTAAICLLLWFTPVALALLWLGGDHVIAREGLFFSQTAVVTFGGAYAVLAYVAQRAVEDFSWLRPGEMVDGLALAETTPGPLIMVLQFVGFVAAHRFPGGMDPWVAGVLGAAMTTWVTFVPCFLFIFVGAPYVEALRRNRSLHAAMSAITAAVVGVVLNLSAWFALHTVFGEVRVWRAGPLQLDLPVWSSWQPGALALAVIALVAMLRFKVGLGWVLLAAAVLGVVIRSW